MRNIIASCAALVACFASGSAAIAATATATSTATLTVSDANACSVTGGSINLGSFKSTDTLLIVSQKLGYWDQKTSVMVKGTDAIGAYTLATVTCQDGLPFIYHTKGNTPDDNLEITLGNGKKMFVFLTAKMVGDTVLSDVSGVYNGFGRPTSLVLGDTWGGARVNAIGNGKAQPVKGNLIPWIGAVNPPTMAADDQVGPVGSYSANFVSTVTF